MAEHENNVFFMGPSTTQIYKINTPSGKVMSNKIVDEEFKTTEIQNAREIMYNDKEKMSELIRDASYVIDMFALENYLIVQTQVGEAVYAEDANAYSLLEKKTKFHVLDYTTLDLLDTFTFSTVTRERPQSRYWTANGKELIHITHYPFNPLEQMAWQAYYFSIEEAKE